MPQISRTHAALIRDENANWLPSPAEGEFFMILRTYQLGESLLKNKWQAPPVTVLDYSKYGVLDK